MERRLLLSLAFVAVWAGLALSHNLATVSLAITESNRPVPCRIHLNHASGQPVRADPPAVSEGERLPFWRDHFVCPGEVKLSLAAGEYHYEVERGPEYESLSGAFTVADGETKEVKLQLKRIADLAREGWWSGELHVHRPPGEVPLLMQAEDLHLAPVITWWNNRNLWATERPPPAMTTRFDGDRFFNLMGGEDEREGGALLFFHLTRPLAIAGSAREFPSPMKFVEEVRRQGGAAGASPSPGNPPRREGEPRPWIDIEKPFWWDVPVWVALAQPDSIGLANNHMCRSQMYATEAWGKPRDAQRLPPPRGNGFWTQEIYYRLLDAGLRIPPSAGSASGVLPNPVGYNRVYVQLNGKLTWDTWWSGLRAGRSFVTNGPLLRVTANGKLSGTVFTAKRGEKLKLSLDLKLTTRDRVEAIEVIHNGRAIFRAATVMERSTTAMQIPLELSESGWFLVRAIADEPKTFRFASTAPFYVEVDGANALGSTRRVSKAAAQFFLDWIRDRSQRVKLDDLAQRDEVLRYHRQAERWWQERLAGANAQ